MKKMSVHRCNSVVTDTSRAKFERFQTLRQNLGDKADTAMNSSTPYMSLGIKYVVIPMSSSGTIPLAQIQANHGVVNTHYQAYQKVSGTGNTAHYPYFDLDTIMSDPRITFTPYDASSVTAQFMSIPNPLPTNGGFATVEDAEAEFVAQGGTIEAGVIYVYITTIVVPGVSGVVLGMSKDLIANALMVDYRTVGSPTSLGPSIGSAGTIYSAGKTLIHELGHCLGLYHPFPADGTCNSTYQLTHYPEGPVQKNPNYYTSLDTLNTTGNCLDNRGRDALRYCTGSATCSASTSNGLNPGDTDPGVAAYSCASRTDLQSASLPYETFMIFMDYGDDSVAVGFPTSSVATMRAVLQTHPELFDVTLVSDPSTGTVVSPTVSPAASSSFPTWAIVVISVVGGLIVIAIIVSVVMAKRGGSGKMPAIKPLVAYQQPFLAKQFV